uniref:Uncharacterized protein n=1 Tax=Rhizophora mucronata TaxID=61149 RepID=A0A2P2R1R9_RHIMU
MLHYNTSSYIILMYCVSYLKLLITKLVCVGQHIITVSILSVFIST